MVLFQTHCTADEDQSSNRIRVAKCRLDHGSRAEAMGDEIGTLTEMLNQIGDAVGLGDAAIVPRFRRA